MWWIQSVYVCPEVRRRGLFKQLYEYVRRESISAKAGEVSFPFQLYDTSKDLQLRLCSISLRDCIHVAASLLLMFTLHVQGAAQALKYIFWQVA